ncbi:nuclear transport factor 2 family protein, partial [Streptomyces sp. SID8455]|nr:nuclear transport factor 2 family protein [Streptomyces sp. SID8455]
YTYTTELLGAQRTDAERWTVTQRLEGDFPGGLVDLRFQFALGGHGLIEQLVIEV